MERTGSCRLERLVAVGRDLLLVDAVKVGLDRGCRRGGVAYENLERGELIEVEAAVVAKKGNSRG